MLNVYFDKYRIIEDFLADAYAGMNRFDEAKVDKYTLSVGSAARAEVRAMETDETGDNGDWYATFELNENGNGPESAREWSAFNRSFANLHALQRNLLTKIRVFAMIY